MPRPCSTANAPIWAACQQQPAGSKSGLKFNDLDNSGSFTPGDTPIADWPIYLCDTSNNLIDSTTTAADGTYEFVIPTNGTYRVCEGVGAGRLRPDLPERGDHATGR